MDSGISVSAGGPTAAQTELVGERLIGHLNRRHRRAARREARRIGRVELQVAGTAQLRKFVRLNWRACALLLEE